MARGPKNTPTVLKKLRGNPGKRPLPKDEPRPKKPSKMPQPPCDLINNVARREWDRIGKELYDLGLLTNIDTTALAMYCTHFALWYGAVKSIKNEGMTTITKNGYPIPNPNIKEIPKHFNSMMKILVEFGMTPSSRSKITTTNKKGDENEESLDKFLNK